MNNYIIAATMQRNYNGGLLPTNEQKKIYYKVSRDEISAEFADDVEDAKQFYSASIAKNKIDSIYKNIPQVKELIEDGTISILHIERVRFHVRKSQHLMI